MFRNGMALLVMAGLAGSLPAQQQERRQRIDVQSYTIEADINPRTQALAATVRVQFTPVDDGISAASFDLNNALNVSKVVDGNGQQIAASRNQQDSSLRLTFSTPLQKGKESSLTFSYDGRLAGSEESPVSGIKFASIQSNYAYLMYPARWFPIHDYTVDRFAADLKVTVPSEFRVLASGLEEKADQAAGGKTTYRFRFAQHSFPGSLAVVQGAPQKINAGGASTTFYLRTQKEMATPLAEEIGKILTYFTPIYGLPLQSNLTVVETDEGAPNGYSAPGMLFLSPRGVGTRVNTRLLANQVARQWWGGLMSPVSRNHIWLTNGMARYSEMLYLEHANGTGALENEVHDDYVEALTVNDAPLIQASRFEDYSPEFNALTSAKGAAVLHMLRMILGDKEFEKLLRTFADAHAYKSISTDEFRKAAETVSGQNLQGFFIQWIESTGAPEFKLEYTVFRTTKGFRVMGKIAQDLDTFRMPVSLKIETEGNPEEKRVEVTGTSSEFAIDTFGKPKKVIIDPAGQVLRYSNPIRVAVAIKRGEQFAEVGEFSEALKEYQKALDVNRNSSLAHYRVAEVFFLQNNYQSAANEFRATLSGDVDPKWTEVWAYINLGKIFDVTSQRDRAINEYNHAVRTKDNTQGAQAEAAKYLKNPYERPRQAEQ